MAKPFKPASKPASAPVAAPAARPAVSAAPAAASSAGRSDVRNSPIPRPASPIAGKKEVTREMIAKRAYEIWQSGSGGSDYDNWIRAERELRGS